MTTYSRADLATRVLRDLGLVAADESPSSDDLDWAEETCSAVIGQLEAEGVSIVGGGDMIIPGEYLIALSKRIGLDIGPSFGLFSIAEAEAAKPLATSALRRINARQSTGSTVESLYY